MNLENPIRPDHALTALRQFVRRKRAAETCEMCSQEVASEHPHLLQLATRRLLCACDGCALLFSNQGNARYKRVPRQVRKLANFQMSDMEWESLLIPINMAFFYSNSTTGEVAVMYPSPAGATESLLSPEGWNDICLTNPILQEMEPDVEALLVNRLAYSQDRGPAEYYISPIDECYRLTGLIRLNWRGLSGGTEVWQAIERFYQELDSKAVADHGASRA